MATTLDGAITRIRSIQEDARAGRSHPGVRWPMIVMRTPKGWTGPAEVDGLPVAGTWRSHQVPLAQVRTNPAHLAKLDQWLRSYKPRELFDEEGRPYPGLLAMVPAGDRRLGMKPHANGGLLLRDLDVPGPRAHAVTVRAPGASASEPTRVLGRMLAEVMRRNLATRNFRVVGPDETESNRLNAVVKVTGKAWSAEIL